MSVDIRSSDRRRYMNEIQSREKDIAASLLNVSAPDSPKPQETDKRHRREIANSNERRRMQCINAGFSNLRALIPQLEGEKLSKAAILQHTTEYITSLEKEKRRLQLQVDQSMRLLCDMGAQGQERPATADSFVACSPPPSKRKKRITESSDEGVGAMSDESDEGSQLSEYLRQEVLKLGHELEVERQRCQALEERNRDLQSRLYTLVHAHQQAQVRGMEEFATNREVVEVIGSMEGMPTPPREDPSVGQLYMHQPPRPLSPTPERGMEVSGSVLSDILTTPQVVADSAVPTAAYRSSLLRASLSPAVKAEVITYRELQAVELPFQHVTATVPATSEPEKRVETPVSTSGALQSSEQPVRGYRDHPRRRHRQQAALERQRQQQEEEEKQRREHEKHQQQERMLAAPQVYRPTPNLENLVEAIRHIEGEGALCDPGRLYEEEHKLYEKRQTAPNSSEESSSISDPDELKSESSGRDSPVHQRRYHQQQQHSIVSERHHLQASSSSSPSLSSLSLSSSAPSESESAAPVLASSLTDYHPAATSLLHHPASSRPSPFYRPAVIVHKQ